MEKYLKEQREKAKNFHDKANCEYDNQNYVIHLDMVAESVRKYEEVFIRPEDYLTALNAAYFHDIIEDAQLTFNDVKEASNKRVAQIVLAVTDVHEENRLLRHLFTMGKTVKDYIAIIVKMADMRANGLYSKEHGSQMYNVYVEEYLYRRPIFRKALKWYTGHLNTESLENFWKELDDIHGYKKQM
jgi:(p)ppGpp synthase/HD superfamily hydrolase